MSNVNPNNMALQDICNYFYRGTELICSVGDMLQCSFDGICVSCDSNYTLRIGVGADVRRAGGFEFQRRLSHAPRTGGVISVPTSGCGSLAATHVILAPVRRTHRFCMNIVYSTIIAQAMSLNLRTLAIPALGTGAFGLSFEEAARFMKMALNSFSSFGSIQKIQFIDLNVGSMNVFASAINSIITLPMNGDDSDTSSSISDSVFAAAMSSQILPSLGLPNQAAHRHGHGHGQIFNVHPPMVTTNSYQPPLPPQYVSMHPPPNQPTLLIIPSRVSRTSSALNSPTALASADVSPSTVQPTTSSAISFAAQSNQPGTSSSSVHPISTASTAAQQPTLSEVLDALANGDSRHITLTGIFDGNSATHSSAAAVAPPIQSTSSAISNNQVRSSMTSRSSLPFRDRKRHILPKRTTRSSSKNDARPSQNLRTTAPCRVLPKFAKWSRTTALATAEVNNNGGMWSRRHQQNRHSRRYVNNDPGPSTSAAAAAAAQMYSNTKKTLSDRSRHYLRWNSRRSRPVYRSSSSSSSSTSSESAVNLHKSSESDHDSMEDFISYTDDEELSSYSSTSSHSSFIDDEGLSQQNLSGDTYFPSQDDLATSQSTEEDDDDGSSDAKESSSDNDSDADGNDVDEGGNADNDDNMDDQGGGGASENDDMAAGSDAGEVANIVNNAQLQDDDDDNGTIYFVDDVVDNDRDVDDQGGGGASENDDVAAGSDAGEVANVVNNAQLQDDDDDNGTIYFVDVVDIGSTSDSSVVLSAGNLYDSDSDAIFPVAFVNNQVNIGRVFMGNQTAVTHSSASSSHSMASGGEHWSRVSVVELKQLRAEYVRNEREKKEKKPSASATNASDGCLAEEEEALPCSICLGEMLSTEGDTANNDYVVRLNVCNHLFHQNCIQMAFDVKRQCPLCMHWCAPAEGNQPIGSKMSVQVVSGKLSGYPNAHGFYEIRYEIPGGIQTAQHPRPGVPFFGTSRVAYLPNSPEGTTTLKLLQLAFDRRLIFTVGDSVTTGRRNVVVWNGIHHKTNKHGGPHNFGYPDPGYLGRVEEELISVGIRKELLLSDTHVRHHISL